MFGYFSNWLILRFVASPHHSLSQMLVASSGVWAERAAFKVLEPGFPRDDPAANPSEKPVRPIPTDVPVPEPMDVPVPEPIDVPPPDPGTVPKPAKNDPKPRSVP
jgi:hypothetical protein